ncbi:hypothetical protein C7B06_26715 [Escherichia coli]|nr:hypothetical protein C7B06_26715 [Escherichia coli]PSZ10309.1 hypothetical protein C7B07_26650 [Escherichia coli]
MPLLDTYISLPGIYILCPATDIRNLTTYHPHKKNKHRNRNITTSYYTIIFMLPVTLYPVITHTAFLPMQPLWQIKENAFHMKRHGIYVARSDGIFMKQFQ